MLKTCICWELTNCLIHLLLLKVDEELEIKAYYAGHVLGAAMFQIKVGNQSVVYTVRNSPIGVPPFGAMAFSALYFLLRVFHS